MAQGQTVAAWIDAKLALTLEAAPPLRRLLADIESRPGAPTPAVDGAGDAAGDAEGSGT